MIDPEHLGIVGFNLLTSALLWMKIGRYGEKVDTMWSWFKRNVFRDMPNGVTKSRGVCE